MKKDSDSAGEPASGTEGGDNTEVIDIRSEGDLENFIKQKRPKLIDLFAEWCAPCKQIGPILEELARKYKGEMAFCKVNVDELVVARSIMKDLNILGIPAVLIYGNGYANILIGAHSKAEYETEIQNALEAAE